MIVRSALTCDTCDQLHVVRIGMGHEERQTHRFPCRQCGEGIVVGLEVDYVNIAHRPIFETNCSPALEGPGAEIVNLDANFLIPAAEQGVDRAFPRMQQFKALMDRAKEMGATLVGVDLDDPKLQQRPMRRPDYLAEWGELKRAWSLQRRNREVFAKPIMKKASDALYPQEPIDGVDDWLFKLASSLLGRTFFPTSNGAMQRFKPALGTAAATRMKVHYDKTMSLTRGRLYLDVMGQYFNAYSEFAQVQFLVSGGVAVNPADTVASADFEKTRMFYGNAFEAFADLIDLVAMLNNLLNGREYDVFEQLTLKKYYELDKVGRTNCFSTEPDFAALAVEFDNQIRNASHHGGMVFDPQTQIITYRSGKGGMGPVQKMTYTEYLVRCVRLFMQVMMLLRIELIFARSYRLRPPL